MSDLNLLPSEAKFQAQKMHLKGLVNNFLWIFGGIWLLLVVVVFGFFLILKMDLDQLTKKYNISLAQYTTLLGGVTVNQKIKYEAKIVAKILSDRFEYGQSMDTIKNLFDEKVSVDSMQIDASKKFTVVGSVNNGQDMDEVETKIAQINSGEIASLVSANLTEVKPSPLIWKFTMEVSLK
jgi:uncharacterized protein YdeI (BOF family)